MKNSTLYNFCCTQKRKLGLLFLLSLFSSSTVFSINPYGMESIHKERTAQQLNNYVSAPLDVTDLKSHIPPASSKQKFAETALDFESGIPNYVTTGTAITSLFTGASNITVEAWINLESYSFLPTIVGNYNGDMQFLLRIDGERLAFWADWTVLGGTTRIPLDTWVHVAGTWDGATIKVYYNGVLENSMAKTGSFHSVPNDVRIGASLLSEAFDGELDEVRIWNTARTEAELNEYMYKCVKGNEAGLVAAYDFENGAGSTLSDLTANHYDGTLISNPEWVQGVSGIVCIPQFTNDSLSIGTVSDNYHNAVIEDFNGDNKKDIFVTAPESNESRFYAGDGTGKFAPYTVKFNASYAYEAGDLDNDGDIDLVCTNATGSAFVYINDGAANFTLLSGTTLMNGTGIIQAAKIADINKDGKKDVIWCNASSGATDQNEVWLNTGTTGNCSFTYATSLPNTSGSKNAIDAGDIDKDGDIDIVAGGKGANGIVYVNTGGTFTVAGVFNEHSGGVKLADWNNDGYLDWINFDDGSFNLKNNNGNGTFGLPTVLFQVSGALHYAISDFNGDGYLDVVTDSVGGRATYWLNTGCALIKGSAILGRADNGIATGDLNGDAKPEILCLAKDTTSKIYKNNISTAIAVLPSTITSTSSAFNCGPGSMALGATASSGIINWYAASTGGSSLITGGSYTTPSIAASITYYVDATNSKGCVSPRVPVTANVYGIPAITGTTAAGRCDAGTLSLEATASSGKLHWYNAATGGTEIGTGSPFTTPVISSPTYYYVGTSDSTTCISLRSRVLAAVGLILTEPADTTINPGANASFSVTAYKATGYRWQVSANGGTSWINAAGGIYSNETTATLNINAAPPLYQPFKYRCIVSGNCPDDTSAIATLNLSVLYQTVSVFNDTICRGDATTVKLDSSQINVQYTLYNGTTAIAGPVAGTGSAITFSTGPVLDNSVLHVIGSSNSGTLQFDGSDDVVTVADYTNIPLANSDYTIEALIKPVDPGHISGIVGWGSYGAYNEVSAFRTNSDGGLINYWWANDITLTPADGGGFNLFDGNWHHVAATFDGTTRKVYVDGTLKKSDIPPGGHNVKAQDFTIAKTLGSENFKGAMDELRIWNVARTQTEIQNAMYAVDATTSGLAAYYTFENGTGSTALTDIAGGESKGTLTNMDPATAWGTRFSGTPYTLRMLDSVKIIVRLIPTVTSSMDAGRCDAGTVTLSATASTGTLNWYDTDSAAIILGTGPTFTTPIINSTRYFYVAATKDGCTSGRTPVMAIVGNILENPVDEGVCQGGNAMFHIMTYLATGYQWQVSADSGATWKNATGGIYSYDDTEMLHLTGVTAAYFEYRYRCIVSGSCPNDTSASATLSSAIAYQTVMATPGAVCPGSSSIITLGSSQTGVNYYLRNGTAVVAGPVAGTGSLIKFITPPLNTPATFNVYAGLPDTTSTCIRVMKQTATVTISALPVVSVTGPTLSCSGAPVILTASGADTYNWSEGGSATPLDHVATYQLAAGLRKLRSAYTGSALRLRRASDDAEADFGFNGNNLDTIAINTFLGGEKGYCSILYDQSGLGNNVIQATASRQPLLICSGLSGRPVLHFSASDQQTMLNTTNFPAPFSVIYAGRQTGPNRQRMLSGAQNNWLLGWWGGGKGQAYYEGWVSQGGSPTDNKAYVYAGSGDGAGNSDIYENGVLLAANGGGNTGPNGISLNGHAGSSELSDGDIGEVFIFASQLSATDRKLIENSSGYYYGIFGQVLTGNPVTVAPAKNTLYIVTGTDATTGCSASASINVDVKPSPAVNATASATTVCNGNSVVLTGSGADTYTWSGNVTDGVAFFPAVTATYTVTGTIANNCSDTATVTITVSNLTTVMAHASATTLCAGESVTLTGSGADTYSWSGNVTDGVAFKPLATATYTVTGADVNKCVGTANVTVNVNPLPNIAVTSSGPTITAAQAGATYQWINCTSHAIIPGATGQSYTTTANGSYAVIVTLSSCSDTSKCVIISTTGINKLTSNNELLVYPNPGKDIITIHTTQEGQYTLINELGQTICILQLDKGNNYTATLEKLSAGLYILIGSDGKQLMKQRIVVEQ